MSQISNTFGAPTSAQPFGSQSSLNDLDLDSFLDLIIVELQNQDPLNPLENDELLAQISQIREVGATEQLTETLDAVLLGQNVSSATNLIGADVEALTPSGERVFGNVGRVTIDNGSPQLELDIAVNAIEGEAEGSVPSGTFVYEIVSTASDGVQESFVLGVDTEQIDNFSGSVQINNLPDTAGLRQVYRTDSSGEGQRRLVATIPGDVNTFVDVTADENRTTLVGGPRRPIPPERNVSITLNNIAAVQPPRASGQ